MSLPVIEHLDAEQDGRIVTIAFNRSGARSAMTFLDKRTPQRRGR